jgi:hypothetical protein
MARDMARDMPRDMRQWDRIGKALANERKYPYVVELVVIGEALDVALSRRIVEFHKSRRIQPRHGRTIPGKDKTNFRWCFSDLATARAFVERFGGAFRKTTGT